ncbi:hypothetical protein EVAR_50456_1 [Eumeta japonica]|uniref:Uncharacterized protein n=1 Tax=Eumeta variegata TaxID=151549 RepID=A0A4C1XRX1_EUMVA|nr:hypothetical protein EVAR_50456_1 [Eumeta japonica]
MLLPALRLSCFGDSGRYAFEMTIRKVTRLYADALWEDDFVSRLYRQADIAYRSVHATLLQAPTARHELPSVSNSRGDRKYSVRSKAEGKHRNFC